MPVAAYPYETQDTTETQYTRIMREVQQDGVADAQGSGSVALSIPGGNLRVNVANGAVWARGVLLEVTGGAEFVTLSAGGGSARTDAIVARFDATNNTGVLAVVQGTTTAIPALTRTDNVWEVLLGTVAVAAGATTLTAANLTDKRVYVGQQIGAWSTALRPGSDGTPAPRKWRTGYNVTTNLIEVWDGAAWQNLGKYIRFVDLVKPAYNLMDGKTVYIEDLPPAANFGADWDIHLEY